MLASPPRPTAPGKGSELRPWKAHPLLVSTTQQPMASTRRNVIRAVTAVPLPPEAAVAGALVSTAVAAAASQRPVSGAAAPRAPGRSESDHPVAPCTPTPRAGF